VVPVIGDESRFESCPTRHVCSRRGGSTILRRDGRYLSLPLNRPEVLRVFVHMTEERAVRVDPDPTAIEGGRR
jgi:hypothetical protein